MANGDLYSRAGIDLSPRRAAGQERLFFPQGLVIDRRSASVKRKPYRQGDVLIKPIAEIPNGLTEIPLENGRLILAHGEVTGHAHVVEGEALFLAADIAELDHRFLQVAECEVVHEEHGTLTPLPGNYEVIRQREYAPEEIRRVAD